MQGWFLDMAKSIFDRTLVKTGNNRQKLEKTRQKPTLFKNPQKYILDIHTKYVLLLWYVGVHISNDFVRILIATTAAVRLILPNTHKFCFQSVLWPLIALNLMFQNLFLITILLQ